MQASNSQPTLSIHASHVRSALAAMDAAETEAAATAAYASLKSQIESFISRTEALREDYYKQRTTIQRQAVELTGIAGERAPAAPGEANVTLQLPEVLSIESRPNCLFIRLSFGLINLLQIALLDVKAKQLYLTSGNVLKLEPEDVRRLVYHCKLFTADAPTGTNPTQ
jgi:hypothetical protein